MATDSAEEDLDLAMSSLTFPTTFVNRGTDGWQLSKSFMERHEYMYETKTTADVCFRVGQEGNTEDVWAHKYMLVANSPVFEAMFDPAWSSPGTSSGAATSTQGEQDGPGTIHIPDISPAAFHEMLRFVYYEEAKITSQNGFGVLYAAKKYQLPDLMTCSKEYILKHIRSDTVCMFLDQSLECAEEGITEACIKYIDSHAVKVLKSSALLGLSKRGLLEVVRSDGLQIDKEKQVYDACMRWSLDKCDQEGLTPTNANLREVLGDVLFCIRFPSMDKEHLLAITQKTDVLSKDEKIEIYESIIGPSGVSAGKFRASKRQSRKESVSVQMTRYKTVTRGFWLAHNAKTTHAISFTLNQNAVFVGIGMFKCANSQPVQAVVEIYDQNQFLVSRINGDNLTMNDYSHSNQDYEFTICGWHFPEPIALSADQQYTVVAREGYQTRTDNIPANIGMNGLPSVTHNGLTIHFADAKSIANNGTKVHTGQLPQLLFKINPRK